MTEEIRRLIGEYAAGALTAEERRRLFAAALEDQELFEELAGEHALKELLDQPGARARIAAALGDGKSARAPWWRRARWLAAAASVAAIAVVFWSVQSKPKPVEVARVSPPPAPLAIEAPKAAPPSAKAPAATEAAPRRSEAKRRTPSVQAIPKNEPAAPPAARDSARLDAEAREQSLGAPAAQAARAFKAQAPAPPGISFDYSVEGAGLRLRFLTAGYVSIRFSTGETTVAGERVEAGATRDQPVPAAAATAEIIFAAAADGTSGGVVLERDSSPGRATDPGGVRVVLTLKLR